MSSSPLYGISVNGPGNPVRTAQQITTNLLSQTKRGISLKKVSQQVQTADRKKGNDLGENTMRDHDWFIKYPSGVVDGLPTKRSAPSFHLPIYRYWYYRPSVDV